MFQKGSDEGYETVFDGVTRKTLAFGARTLMTEFRLRRGSALPRHAHEHEQTGILVKGRLRLHLGDKTHDVEPGDSWCIAGGIEHGADAIDDAVAVEVFSPVRLDYLPPEFQ
jgi:quercetin dioxygenase-like cupin family protein